MKKLCAKDKVFCKKDGQDTYYIANLLLYLQRGLATFHTDIVEIESVMLILVN